MNIYERIKSICDTQNITISTVESSVNISNGSISKWKNQIPKADNLYSVAKFLGKSVEYFLTGKEPTNILTKDQQELLDLYSQLDPLKQAEFKGELKGYLKAQPSENKPS